MSNNPAAVGEPMKTRGLGLTSLEGVPERAGNIVGPCHSVVSTSCPFRYSFSIPSMLRSPPELDLVDIGNSNFSADFPLDSSGGEQKQPAIVLFLFPRRDQTRSLVKPFR
jgi:hypothetical protein